MLPIRPCVGGSRLGNYSRTPRTLVFKPASTGTGAGWGAQERDKRPNLVFKPASTGTGAGWGAQERDKRPNLVFKPASTGTGPVGEHELLCHLLDNGIY